MAGVSHFFKYFQALSLDVALGGVIGSIFIANYLDVSVDPKTYAILGATIWLIYTFDHLMDTQNVEEPPITFRHRFHWKNSTSMWGVWSFCLIMVLSMLYKLPTITLIYGVSLGVLVLLYFISLRFFKGDKLYHKEIVGASFYSSGIFIPSVSLYEFPIGLDAWILFIEMFSVAYINLLIYSIFERVVDKHEGYHSLVRSLNLKNVKGVTWGLIIAVFIISGVSIFIVNDSSFRITQFVIGTMNISLAVILLKSDYFIINTRYRILGDAIFIFPVIYLFIPYVI